MPPFAVEVHPLRGSLDGADHSQPPGDVRSLDSQRI